MITNVLLISIFSIICLPSVAQEEIPVEIIESLKSGNAKILSAYFNQNVELQILEEVNSYSRAQAQQIINKFFSDYQPQEFTIIQQSPQGGPRYIIGSLKTKKRTFRVYVLLKKDKDKIFIHKLSFLKPLG
jgi:Domain of unknown function (DUF4783)